MSSILVGGALKFTEVNTPTREGELIGSISEIYDIPTPRLGMWVYVKDEGKFYIVKSLKSKVIDGVIVDDAAVESFGPLIADGVVNGAISSEMLNESLREALVVVDSLNDNNPHRPLSARQGYLLRQMINALDGSDASLEEFTRFLSTVYNEIASLDGKITALSAGLKLTLSVSPSVIHKNDANAKITLTAKLEDTAGAVVAERIVLKDNSDNEIDAGVDVSSFSKSGISVVTASSSEAFKASAIYNGMTLNAKASVSARYPVYVGMGTSPESVVADINKMSATTSAANKTYSARANADNVSFYLLVPTDVTQPTSFSMGGAPFAMKDTQTKTIGGVQFKIYQSGEPYDTGTTVSIETK